jgi:hypothetical protein
VATHLDVSWDVIKDLLKRDLLRRYPMFGVARRKSLRCKGRFFD